MLTVIKHIVDNSIIYLSATAAVQTLNFISPELWSQQARAELSWLQDFGSLLQREYELQVNKTEEMKQWLIELWWKSSVTTFKWKHAIFICVSVFPQVVQKH